MLVHDLNWYKIYAKNDWICLFFCQRCIENVNFKILVNAEGLGYSTDYKFLIF